MRTFQQLQEGIYDPNIFKAVFLAGGPGSGKSYIVGRTLGGLGLKIINSDDPFERYLKAAGLSLRMPESEKAPRDIERKKAKNVTSARKGLAIDGRLGIIIDGTGKDYSKITTQAGYLEQLGYECSMVFVNTSLETALERNQKRSRRVQPALAKKGWESVQSNLLPFKRHFGTKFFEVNNNDLEDDLLALASKAVARAIRGPVTSPIAKEWIADQMRKRNISALNNLDNYQGRNVGKGGGAEYTKERKPINKT